MVTFEPVVIDPRRHDAVLFALDAAMADSDAAVTLLRRLQGIGVGTARVAVPASASALVELADRLKMRPGRCVVVATHPTDVESARAGGFALVIGVDGDALGRSGADAVVAGLGDIRVRTGDQRMSELPDALQAAGLIDDLASRRPAVFFDFDGTLSDIVNDPDTATLVAGAAEALRELAGRCPVAVLSGRDLADVTERVGLPGIWYAGSHGFELTAPDGRHHQNDDAAAAIPVLERAAAELRDQLGSISGVVAEHKRFGVAVHYRNAARDRVGEVTAAVRAAGQRDVLRVTTGREVIELRPDIDWDKGKTLRWVIDHLQRAGSGPVMPIFLGDDITDEDAFDAVRPTGVPIVVRHSDDGDRATAALFALDSPARVSEFARRLAQQIAHARAT
ncbi:trehalose-phosphate phosphatase [Mycobacterium conspicuum]|uniref:Trehalose 6-phosphate phosphatase n=2 Tax=Mycobacterium conspicuum TaxID=44010 RepID=A0A7I7Y7X5_9MYCO|nr:trehalose-phosphate phosphatase [Mycobacterium conspicuum]